jgi:hypothetical protein
MLRFYDDYLQSLQSVFPLLIQSLLIQLPTWKRMVEAVFRTARNLKGSWYVA